MDPSSGIIPAATVACAPTINRDGTPFTLTNEQVADAVLTALQTPLDPIIDTFVPKTLIPDTMLQEKVQLLPNTPPRFVTNLADIVPHVTSTSTLTKVEKVEVKTENDATRRALGITQRRLQNGVKVNFKSLGTEPQRISLRMYLPGGRIREEKNTQKSGAIVVGARTMQEGGGKVYCYCCDVCCMLLVLSCCTHAGMLAVALVVHINLSATHSLMHLSAQHITYFINLALQKEDEEQPLLD